jgi:calcium-dependent protein kinase
METRIGTPYYMAPEVLDGAYSEACDMWSLGVITYCLLCGYPPFNADTDAKLFRKIQKCEFEFYMPEWGSVSPESIDFIRKLLKLNPNERMSPEEALRHPWITERQNPTQVNRQVLQRLALFKKPTLFQKEILLILGALLNSKELKEIRDTFFAIDADSSGTITLNELKAALLEAGSAEDNSPEEIIKRVDFDENGEINYSEFVSSTLDRSLMSEANL